MLAAPMQCIVWASALCANNLKSSGFGENQTAFAFGGVNPAMTQHKRDLLACAYAPRGTCALTPTLTDIYIYTPRYTYIYTYIHTHTCAKTHTRTLSHTPKITLMVLMCTHNVLLACTQTHTHTHTHTHTMSPPHCHIYPHIYVGTNA